MKHRAVVQSRWAGWGFFIVILTVLPCFAVNYSSDAGINGPLYIGCRGADTAVLISQGAQVHAGSVVVGWSDPSAEGLLEISGDAALVVTDACSRPAPCEVRCGTVWLDGGEVVSDSITIWEHSTLGGRGTVYATTLCEGTLKPGAPLGTLVHHGVLALAQTATAGFEIGGYEPDFEYDRVFVDGRVCLAGRLNLNLVNGFIPQAGDRFVILTGLTVSGAFSDAVVSNLPPDLAADVVADDTSVTVVFSAR